MGDDPSVRLDLSNPVFQHGLLQLQKAEQLAVLGTLRKLSDMTWNQVYRDGGLKLGSDRNANGSSRSTSLQSKSWAWIQGVGLSYREEHWMRILSLHTDHDSAYQ